MGHQKMLALDRYLWCWYYKCGVVHDPFLDDFGQALSLQPYAALRPDATETKSSSSRTYKVKVDERRSDHCDSYLQAFADRPPLIAVRRTTDARCIRTQKERTMKA